MSEDALVITHSPVAAAGRVARWMGLVQSRVVSALIITVLAVVLYLVRRPLGIGNDVGTWIMVGFVVMSWIFVLLTVVMWIGARRHLRSLREGEALRLDRSGITVGDLRLPWSQVATLAAKPGAPLGTGTLVVADLQGNKRTVDLDDVNILPADLDNAVRAYSMGTVGVDLGLL